MKTQFYIFFLTKIRFYVSFFWQKFDFSLPDSILRMTRFYVFSPTDGKIRKIEFRLYFQDKDVKRERNIQYFVLYQGNLSCSLTVHVTFMECY